MLVCTRVSRSQDDAIFARRVLVGFDNQVIQGYFSHFRQTFIDLS